MFGLTEDGNRSHMCAHQILPTTDLICHYLRGKVMSLKKEVQHWALSFNHTSSVFFSFTLLYFNISSHQLGHSALYQDNNLPEKGGKDSSGQTERKEKESVALDYSQVPFSLEEVWSIRWEHWFPCESGLAPGLTCTGTSLIAQGLWFGESQDVWDSGGNGAASMKVPLWSLFVR